MTTTMRVSVLRKPGDIILEDRPVPAPGAQQVLVKVAAVGVCGSDTHYFETGRVGDFVVDSPLVLGHEASGQIVDVGAGVDPNRIGQRVAIEPGVPDLRCAQCLAGRYNLCPNMRFFATPPVDGAFAEYVLVHSAFAHTLPDDVDDEAGALLEPLSVGLWAARKGAITVGARVLITGAGPVGLLAAQVARIAGATEITVVDVVAPRLHVAESLAATRTLDIAGRNLRTPDEVAQIVHAIGTHDVLLECSGHAGAIGVGLRSLERAGTAVLVGMGSDTLSLPVGIVQERELTVTGIFRYANTWPTAIDLVARGRVALAPLVTDRFSLADVPAAMVASRSRASALKAMVLPGK